MSVHEISTIGFELDKIKVLQFSNLNWYPLLRSIEILANTAIYEGNVI